MSDRPRLALPVDVARMFDITVPQAQIDSDTFLSESVDNPDALASLITDAADEFRAHTADSMTVSRVGVAGQRETFEQATYRLSGHKQYRQRFSHYTFDYDYDVEEVHLDNDRILPFDPAEGDAAYIWRGLDDTVDGGWEEVTADRGETWDIIDYVNGVAVLHPREIQIANTSTSTGVTLGSTRLNNVRLALSYRYGTLGGDRGRATETTLSSSLNSSDTGTVSVGDGSGFPVGQGEITVRIDSEYLSVAPDPGADSMDIRERGIRGTTAASHDADATVHYTPPAVRKAVAARAGQMLITSRRYRGWLPDTEDDLDMDAVHTNLGDVWTGTLQALGGGGSE